MVTNFTRFVEALTLYISNCEYTVQTDDNVEKIDKCQNV